MLQLRHVTSINDLAVDEIETIFSLAQRYLKDLRDPDVPHRIGRSARDAGRLEHPGPPVTRASRSVGRPHLRRATLRRAGPTPLGGTR